MLAHVRLHPRRMLGLLSLLTLFCGGLIVSGPMLRRVDATRVRVEELQDDPTTYLNQFIEMQGNLKFVGLGACNRTAVALFSLSQPTAKIDVSLHIPFDQIGFRQVKVWGQLRRDAAGVCGSTGPVYLDVQDVQVLDATSTP